MYCYTLNLNTKLKCARRVAIVLLCSTYVELYYSRIYANNKLKFIYTMLITYFPSSSFEKLNFVISYTCLPITCTYVSRRK